MFRLVLLCFERSSASTVGLFTWPIRSSMGLGNGVALFQLKCASFPKHSFFSTASCLEPKAMDLSDSGPWIWHQPYSCTKSMSTCKLGFRAQPAKVREDGWVASPLSPESPRQSVEPLRVHLQANRPLHHSVVPVSYLLCSSSLALDQGAAYLPLRDLACSASGVFPSFLHYTLCLSASLTCLCISLPTV
jgi:hypothetical protein